MERLFTDIIRDVNRGIRENVDINHHRPQYIKNLSQARIIFYLHEHENEKVSQKDIGDNLKLRKSSITEHLDYLENIGLVERKIDSDDKRFRSICLSDKARMMEETFRNTIVTINDKLIKDIPEKDLETCKHVLLQMEKNLRGE